MRVTVVRGGGVAGLVTTTTVDAGELSAGDAEKLRELVAAAVAPGRPSENRPGSAAPDRFAFEVTVEAEGTTRLRAGEADLSTGLRELVTWVQSAPARRLRVGPPGSG